MLEATQLESRSAEKDLGTKWNMSQQYALAAQRANKTWVTLGKVSPTADLSLVRPHLECTAHYSGICFKTWYNWHFLEYLRSRIHLISHYHLYVNKVYILKNMNN